MAEPNVPPKDTATSTSVTNKANDSNLRSMAGISIQDRQSSQRRRAGSKGSSTSSKRRLRGAVHSQEQARSELNQQSRSHDDRTTLNAQNSLLTGVPANNPATAGSSSSSPATGTMSKEPTKKKSSISRFLAFLSCCSGSSHDRHADNDGVRFSEKPDASNKASTPLPERQTQPTSNHAAALNPNVASKQSASAAQSSTADSKELMDEKAFGQGQQTQVGMSTQEQGQLGENLQKREKATEFPMSSSAGQEAPTALPDGQKSNGSSEGTFATHVTPATKQTDTPGADAVAAVPVGQQWRAPDGSIASHSQNLHNNQQRQQIHLTPNGADLAVPVTGKQEDVIHDQTDAQKRTDADIEMTDAGQGVPLSKEDFNAGSVPVGATSAITSIPQSQPQVLGSQGQEASVSQPPEKPSTSEPLASQQSSPIVRADRDSAIVDDDGDNNTGVNSPAASNVIPNSKTAIAVGATAGAAVAGAAGVATGLSLQANSGAPPSPGTSIAVTPIEAQKYLLPPIRPEFKGKKCLVLDLDETLVHSSFKVCSTLIADPFSNSLFKRSANF